MDITIVDETSHPLAGVTLSYEDKTEVPVQEVVGLGYGYGRPTSIGPYITHRKVRTVTTDASGHAHFELKWDGAALSASAQGSDLHVFQVYSGGYGSDLLAYLAGHISKGSGMNNNFSSQHADWTHFTVFVTSFKRIREKAERGDPNAQYVLAWSLRNGYGVAENGPEAFAWYRIAAKQNNDAKLIVSDINQTHNMMHYERWREFLGQSDKYVKAFEAKIKSLAP
ncbi:hypothetical protein [Prosthecobacter sp.]|uniref:tetratricopeptide repeat protein n=1 Tax=Prosthecobacter sp. TaxID=1965333 RepID=UPI001DD68115|nr:hypothetical protein [Prosthecobacter sp.]MCB1277374.1 sel1 repeat family protein [Prosthecobacter sp.]